MRPCGSTADHSTGDRAASTHTGPQTTAPLCRDTPTDQRSTLRVPNKKNVKGERQARGKQLENGTVEAHGRDNLFSLKGE